MCSYSPRPLVRIICLTCLNGLLELDIEATMYVVCAYNFPLIFHLCCQLLRWLVCCFFFLFYFVSSSIKCLTGVTALEPGVLQPQSRHGIDTELSLTGASPPSCLGLDLEAAIARLPTQVPVASKDASCVRFFIAVGFQQDYSVQDNYFQADFVEQLSRGVDCHPFQTWNIRWVGCCGVLYVCN